MNINANFCYKILAKEAEDASSEEINVHVQ
jgi:hypothetical protein